MDNGEHSQKPRPCSCKEFLISKISKSNFNLIREEAALATSIFSAFSAGWSSFNLIREEAALATGPGLFRGLEAQRFNLIREEAALATCCQDELL